VEKIGGLYTQHYSGKDEAGSDKKELIGGKRFDLVYEGELAAMSNAPPLFAALV
jgi:D-3-phosphoglycerate dehydrogenase